MSIGEHETTSNSLTLYWLNPRNLSLEYLPSISESRMPETTVNKTWVSKTSFKFTSLKPFTLYNLTVFVRQKEFPDIIYPPVVFALASTAEGGMYIIIALKEINELIFFEVVF